MPHIIIEYESVNESEVILEILLGKFIRRRFEQRIAERKFQVQRSMIYGAGDTSCLTRAYHKGNIQN